MPLKFDALILSVDYGLGRIIDSNTTQKTKVRFYSPETKKFFERTLNEKDFQVLPIKVVTIIRDFFAFETFNSRTKERAVTYSNLDRISSFHFDAQTMCITARIKGETTYITTLYLTEKRVSCTCPSFGNCKHSYALLNFLAVQLEHAMDGISRTQHYCMLSRMPVATDNLDAYTRKFISNYLDIDAAKDLLKYLEYLYQTNEYNDYFDNLCKLNFSGPNIVQGIVDLFAIVLDNYNALFILTPTMNRLSRSYFRDYARLEAKCITQLDINPSFYKRLHFGGPDVYQFLFYDALIKDDLFSFVEKMTEDKFVINGSLFLKNHLNDILKYLVKDSKNDVVSFKIIAFLNENSNQVNTQILKELFSRMDNSAREQCYKHLPDELYRLCSPNEIASYFSEFSNKRLALEIINKKLDTISDDSKGKLGCDLVKIGWTATLTPDDKELIEKIYKGLPKSTTFDKYRKIRPQSFKHSSLIPNNELNLERNYRISLIKDKNWNIYFDVISDIEEVPNGFVEKIRMVSKNGDVVVRVNIPSSPQEMPTQEDLLDDEEENYYPFFIVKISENTAEFKDKLEIIQKKQQHYENELMDQKLLEGFETLEKNNVLDATTTLSDDSKISIQYYFSQSIEGDYILSFKIGINKFYVVSNALNFIDSFRANQYVRYGKDLAFQHRIENLKEEDRIIINELMNLSLSKSRIYGNKILYIPEKEMPKLLELLKGRAIYWNDLLCVLRLDYHDIKISVDNEYIIQPVLEKGQSLLLIMDEIYLLDENTNTIDYVTKNKSKQRLIRFASKFSGASIVRVKDAFNEKVYPAYCNDFILDGAIREEFKHSELLIESYFDINSKQEITLETCFKKDDQLLYEEEIQNNYDIAKIRNYKQLMETLGFENNLMSKDENILNFLAMDFGELKKTTNIFISDELNKKKIVSFVPPLISMNHHNGTMDIFLEKSIYSDEELSSILSALKKKKKFVILKDNKIIKLDDKNILDFNNFVENLSLDKKHLSEHVQRPIYISLIASSNSKHIELDAYLKQMVEEIKNFKLANYKLPRLNAELRNYQIEGYKWLRVLTDYNLGGILADDMGLGKTLEIISLLASDTTAKPSLIVAPKSLLFNWLSEFNRFAPYCDVKMIYGLSKDRLSIIHSIKVNKKVIYVTSFDSLRNDVKNYNVEFNYLILDEAQYIKNIHALKTQNVKKVNAMHRFALTGTPIENDIFDLWSIFDFLMPKFLPSLTKFKENANDEDFQKMIAKRVAPFILRRTKKEMLKDLPPKYERVLSSEMSKEQRKLYDAIRLEARQILEDKGKAFNVLHLLTRLRQVCVDPRTFVENYNGKSGKTEMLKALIKEYVENNHRILIFSQFVTALNIIEEFLKKEQINYFKITGDTPSEDRIKQVKQFNKDHSIKVFLISLKAGGNGLNLVGADTVIHYDPWWNIAAENQATDRAYRIGQTKNVEVIRLIAEDSIEQRVIELQNKKKDLIDKLISDDTSAIEKVSINDLKFMLQ